MFDIIGNIVHFIGTHLDTIAKISGLIGTTLGSIWIGLQLKDRWKK